LGLNRDDPATCLDAFTDGEELRVDLGIIGDRTFVNNASFGAYAEVVKSPAYRDDKRGTSLQMLPDLVNGHQDRGPVAPSGPAPSEYSCHGSKPGLHTPGSAVTRPDLTASTRAWWSRSFWSA
jgi:hypothetical protein